MFNKKIEWILRVAIFGEFLGHGVFALEKKAAWIKYFEAVGMTPDTANTLMPYIGIADIALALVVLFIPFSAALLWMAVWGLWTALIRWPVGPDPMWDFFERWANWGAPFALFYYYGFPESFADWFRLRNKQVTYINS